MRLVKHVGRTIAVSEDGISEIKNESPTDEAAFAMELVRAISARDDNPERIVEKAFAIADLTYATMRKRRMLKKFPFDKVFGGEGA